MSVDGNKIVQPSSKGQVEFPMLILAAVVVGAGIYALEQYDRRAAWLLAFLVLLGIAFNYKNFGDELTGLFGGVSWNQQFTSPGQLLPGQQGPLPTGMVSETV